MGRDVCIICQTRSSSKFTSSSSYEHQFESCFGQDAVGHQGKICASCRKNLSEHAKDVSKTFFVKLDCRKTNTIPKKLEIRKQKSEKLEELWSNARALSRFLSLPNEVWLLILKKLSARDLLAFGLSCQKPHKLSEEPILWKNLYKDAKKTPVLFDFGENWKAAYVLVKVCAQNNSSLTLQRELDKLQDENSQIDSENKKASATLTQLRSTLDFLSHNDANSHVTATEEIIFRNILHKKEVQSTNDLIEAKNPRGRSKFFQTVRMVEVPSNEAASHTLRERSRSNEKFVTLTSTSDTNTKTRIILQR